MSGLATTCNRVMSGRHDEKREQEGGKASDRGGGRKEKTAEAITNEAEHGAAHIARAGEHKTRGKSRKKDSRGKKLNCVSINFRVGKREQSLELGHEGIDEDGGETPGEEQGHDECNERALLCDAARIYVWLTRTRALAARSSSRRQNLLVPVSR